MISISNIEKEIRQYDKLVNKVIKNLKYIPRYIDKAELKQIATIRLWEALQEYEEVEGIKKVTILYRKINSTLIDYLRKMETTVGRELPIEFESELKDEISEDKLVDGLLGNEVKRIIKNKMDADIFIDIYANKYSYEEVKEKYQISNSTLGRKLQKTKEKLQKQLDWN